MNLFVCEREYTIVFVCRFIYEIVYVYRYRYIYMYMSVFIHAVVHIFLHVRDKFAFLCVDACMRMCACANN